MVVEYLIYQEVDERLVVERRDFEHFIARPTGIGKRVATLWKTKITLKACGGAGMSVASLPVFKDTVLV